MGKGISNTQIAIILTVPITIASIITITSLLITSGLVGGLGGDIRSLSDQVNSQPALEDLLAQLPVSETILQEQANATTTQLIIEQPEGFKSTDEDVISAFLSAIGIKVTETFAVKTQVNLIDANFASQIESSQVKIQPLDPRQVILPQAPTTDNLRLFINTDFSRQISDDGRHYHKFSGWDVVNDGGIYPVIPVAVTTTVNCSGIDNTGLCIQAIGSRSCSDNCGATGSVLHGVSKKIDMSDWTGEGDVVLNIDWYCNPSFRRSLTLFVVNIQGESSLQETVSSCNGVEKYTKEISDLIGNSNTVTIQFGARAGSTHKFNLDYKWNNVQVIGNSIVKRTANEAIDLINQLSIIKNDKDQTLLDLGIIETQLEGVTVFDNERVVLQGVLETRIGASIAGGSFNDKTVSTHQLTANGITSGKTIPLRIDGQDKFYFKLDEQFYQQNSFNKLTFLINDMVVNIGEGDDLRTFEYHTPFVFYLLEFNVRQDEIIAFNEKDLAISVLKNDSTFKACGLSAGDINPEILPPIVSIQANGFTIATTNPIVGKGAITDPITKEIKEDAEFCQTIPNLPRGTELTFKIGNSFFEVFSPTTQSNFFVKCTTKGCSSNIGFSSLP